MTLVVSLVNSRLDCDNEVLCGLPGYMYRRLQSIIALARWIIRQRRSEDVSLALVEIHWLSVADCVTFKVTTLVQHYLHHAASSQLSSALHLVADVDTRRQLRSRADTQILLTPYSRLVTTGDRSYQIAGPRIRNSHLYTERTAPSLLSFKRQLKTIFFFSIPNSYIAYL
jgi:hypothetical protein